MSLKGLDVLKGNTGDAKRSPLCLVRPASSQTFTLDINTHLATVSLSCCLQNVHVWKALSLSFMVSPHRSQWCISIPSAPFHSLPPSVRISWRIAHRFVSPCSIISLRCPACTLNTRRQHLRSQFLVFIQRPGDRMFYSTTMENGARRW